MPSLSDTHRARLRASGDLIDQLLLAALLGFAFLAGGGGDAGASVDRLLIPLAVGSSGWFLARHFTGARLIAPGVWPFVALISLVLASALVQLPALSASWLEDLRPWAAASYSLELAKLDDATLRWSLSPFDTLRFMGAFALPAALLLGFGGSLGRTPYRNALRLGLIAALAGAALIFLQSLAPGRDLLHPWGEVPGTAAGLFANPNFQGTFLALTILVLGMQGIIAGFPGRNIALVGMVCFLFLAIVLTDSRGAIAIGVVAVLLLALSEARRPNLLARRKLVLPLVAMAGIAMLLLAFRHPLGLESGIRGEAVPVLAAMIRESFPLGVGWGAFGPAWARAEPLDLVTTVYFNEAHNDWLQWVLEGGLIGLLVLAAFLWLVVRSIRKRPDKAERAFLPVAMLVLIAAQSVVDFPLRTDAVAALCVLALIGLIAPWEQRRSKPQRKTAHMVIAGVAGLGVIALMPAAYKMASADAAYQNGQWTRASALSPLHGDALARHALVLSQDNRRDEAVEAAQQSLRATPLNAIALAVIAQNYRENSLEPDEEDAAMRFAASLDWRPEFIQYAALQLALIDEDTESAVDHAEAMMRAYPATFFGRQATFVASLDPEFRAEMVSRLEPGSNARRWLYLNPPLTDVQIDGMLALSDELAARQGPITPDEQGQILYQLTRGGREAAANGRHATLFALDDWQHRLFPEVDTLAWRYEAANGLLARPVRNSIRLEAGAGIAAPLARRTTVFEPGRYEVMLGGEVDGGADAARLALYCPGETEARAVLRAGRSGVNAVFGPEPVTILLDCAVQEWRLESDGTATVDLRIDDWRVEQLSDPTN
ncbi:O-antigen ligase family protein [Sphingomicrobium sediminis]|uniref:O-antigen ligase family protein n=1 Tax=Sphingomicrobium sediminis TaxID=2950949 RepID=A0A9X2J2U6_9SPHN|nr:O-antigen ligase family protein [Sphingomicrobium sediminis]MCM8556646.1 O-antigen ligase family protein [Sphingomicrobium sediminis]